MATVGRLKDGEFLISGEYNERLPTITQGLICHFPFDGNGGTFDLVGGFQPIQHTTGNLNLAEAINLDWRNPSSWMTFGAGSINNVSWDDEKQAIKIKGNTFLKLKTPIIIDTTKTYKITAEVMQENDEAGTSTTLLYLGGHGLTSAGANYTTNYDYSLVSAADLTLGQWTTYTRTRTGTGNYPMGWTSTNGVCYKYHFGGLFNYYGSANAVIYIRNISIVVTDADNSNCTFTNDGIAVEEATTNLLSDPSFESGTVWGSYGTPTAKEIVARFASDGRYSFHFAKSAGDSTRAYHSGFTTVVGRTYTASFDITAIIKGNPVFTLGASGLDTTTLTVDKPGRYSMSIVATSTLTFFRIGSVATCGEFDCFIDAVQVEEKPFATSFVNGSRSARGVFHLPKAVMDFQSFSVVMKLKLDQSAATGINNMYFDAYPKLYMYRIGTTHIVSFADSAQRTLNFSTVPNTEEFTVAVTREYISSTNVVTNIYYNGVLSSSYTSVTEPSMLMNQNTGDFIKLDSLGGSNVANSCIESLSFYNRALSADEVKKLYSSKLSIESDGDIKQITVKESPAIPSDVYYFPLTLNGKDRYGVISPQTDTNVVYSKEGAWIGTAVTNLANVSDFTYWINSGNGNDLPDGIARLQSDVPVYGFTCTTAGSIGCEGGAATISPSSVYSMGVDAYYSSCTTGNPYAREYRTSAPGGANSAYLEYQTKDAVGTIIPQNTWVNIIYQNITATADANSVKYSAYIGNAGEKLYFTRPMIVSRPFLPPFCNGSRGSSNLSFNLYTDLGLDWNGDWSVVYWKKPIGTNNNLLTGYNVESLGCNSNSVGGGYVFWGKNAEVNALISISSYAFTSYFDKWHMISLVKNGTTVTRKAWGIDGTIQYSTAALSAVVSNYYVTQHGYDFKFGWDISGVSNTYYRDLVVAKRALTDTELTTIYNTQMRAYNSNSTLLIRNGINETNNL